MILLIPLSRFRVTFEAGSGRPYSKLESLILRAVADGVGDLDGLRTTFGIHPRLLIEALVTLTQAGWLAVSSSPGRSFVLTSEGQKALGAGDDPSTLLILPKEPTYVLMERLTAQLISARDARYVVDRELEDVKAKCVRLNPRVSGRHTDESQVQHLLPRAQGEWIRWVGPIDLVGRESLWLPVTADLASERISGLPYAWRHLGDSLLDAARRHEGSLTQGDRTASWSHKKPAPPTDDDAPTSSPHAWPVELTEDNLLRNSSEHDGYLRKVLLQAESSVFIASAFVTALRLEAIKDQVTDALRRGVSVDLLWGYGAERQALNFLTNLAIDAKKQGWPGKLRSNRNASQSHAKLVLWDCASNQFEACIGSCNWLSFAVPSDRERGEVSIKLSHHGLLAQLSRCAASLWRGTKDVLSAVPGRWQQVASEMERLHQQASTSPTANAEVRLVLDGEHEWCLREWLASARRRLLVSSHRLGPVAATRLVAAEGRTREEEFTFKVVYGLTELEAGHRQEVAQRISATGGSLLHFAGQHAKVVVSDDTACVSSYNFLSADPFQTASNAREVGLVLKGREPADWLFDHLNSGTS